MKESKVKKVTVPNYEEFAVNKIAKKFIKDDEICYLVPELEKKKKIKDREYFFNVVNTIYKDSIKNAVDYAIKRRIEAQSGRELIRFR